MAIDGGHSALAEDAKRFDTLYHGTTSNHVGSILRQGLIPQSTFTGGDNRKQTYVSTNHEEAAYHAKEKNMFSGNKHLPVVLHLDRNHSSIKGLKSDPEYDEGVRSKNFYTENYIHPDAIKRIEPIKGVI